MVMQQLERVSRRRLCDDTLTAVSGHALQSSNQFLILLLVTGT